MSSGALEALQRDPITFARMMSGHKGNYDERRQGADAVRSASEWVLPISPAEAGAMAMFGPFSKAAKLGGLSAMLGGYGTDADAGELAEAAKDPRQYIRALWYGLRHGMTDDATDHAKLYRQESNRLFNQMGNTPEYDTTKNYLGGYDWGYRMHDNPERAADMARSYQLSDYLLGNKQDAELDAEENIVGVYAGAAAKQRGEEFDIGTLRRLAAEFAKQNKR